MIEMKLVIEDDEKISVQTHAAGETHQLLQELSCGCADLILEMERGAPGVEGLAESYARMLLSYILDVIHTKKGGAAR